MADLNQIAARIVKQATDEQSEPPKAVETTAQRNGRIGGLKGGKVRAVNLTSQRRSEIASWAARARWAKQKGS